MQRAVTERLNAVPHRIHLSYIGSLTGLIFFCLSFTPSLLPRGYVVQGIASGLSFATGYGVGAAIAYFYHKLPRKFQLRPSVRVKQILFAQLSVITLIFIAAGFHWQAQVREITQASPNSGDYPLKVVIIAAILAALLIWAARGARHFGRFLGGKLQRFLGPKAALYLGGVLATILIVFLVNGVIFKAVFGAINYTFGLANKGTPAGIHQPQDPAQTGSPASAIDWNTLGEKGREFVATAPAQTDVEKFSGVNAEQPNRLYVGLQSAPTLQERVDLLVKELERTKANERQAVLIAIPTGSGGVNAKSVQSVEYLYGGDTTSLAIQYSYLPSWLSFLADQETARETGRVLTEAVYGWWSHLDPAQRPKLLMYGESLGTLGADGAFSGASDMHARMSGVLLAGPPNANQLWSGMVADRDEGTPQVLPTYKNGEIVRFDDGLAPFVNPKDKTWLQNRVGILQNASDPVVWGSLSLFMHKPDWLREPRGSDVLPNMRWYPFVTGWQVALDLPFAFGATPGHGHRYGDDLAASWTQVLDITLTPEQTTQLKDIINQVKG